MDDAKENARAAGNGAGREGAQAAGERRNDNGNYVAESARKMPLLFEMETYLREGLQLIPLHRFDAVDKKGRPRGKSPRDGSWQLREYDSAAVMADALKKGTNVGVRLPAGVMVLDVDPRNFPAGRDPLADLVRDAGIDLSVAPHTITGSGGHHYWFRKPPDVTLLDSLEDYPGVEFKSRGRQVVSAGSIHPTTGGYYSWDDFGPPLSQMPPMPDVLLRLTRRPVRAHGEAAGLGELTPEMLEATLEQLDPEDFKEHGDWLNLMMACHHATAGEGRQEFIDWSTGDKDYRDDGWVIGRRWDSLHARPTAGRNGRPVTVKYLHKVVQEHGGYVARPEPEDDFQVWEPDDEIGAGVDDAKLRQMPKAEGVDAIIEEMNSRHYVVMDNGFQVVTEEPDPIFDGRVRYLRHSKTDFRSMYENQSVELAGGKVVSRGDLWLKSPNRLAYKGIIFDPSGDHKGWLNMWKGWAVQPSPGAWDLLDSLIRDVLTDGDAASYEYVLNWIAFMFQHPEKVAEVAIAFRGAKGTGKSTLGRALCRIAGAHGLQIGSPGLLVGRFNSHLQDCVCLFADEAFWAGDKSGESVLKMLVTEPTIAYEGKGRDAVQGRNHVHLMMASNNDWLVPAGMDGERRFAVFNVNEKRRQDSAFFDALNRQLEQGGHAGFLHDMLARNISDWHPRDNVPQTEALREQIELSQSPEESWWESLLDSGKVPGIVSVHSSGQRVSEMAFDAPWGDLPVEVEKDVLHAHYVSHALQLRQRPRDKKALARRIMKRAGIEVRQAVVDGTRIWRWVLPPIEQARAIWERSKRGG